MKRPRYKTAPCRNIVINRNVWNYLRIKGFAVYVILLARKNHTAESGSSVISDVVRDPSSDGFSR